MVVNDSYLNYPFAARVLVRWSDLDELGMVNNAKYLTYFEEARAFFFLEKLAWDWTQLGSLVASIQINYKSPVRYGHKITVFMGVEQIKNASFSLKCAVCSRKEDDSWLLHAEGSVVMVAYDLQTQKPTALPVYAREALAGFLLV
ncbi:MAG: acyl-CoA thioesterase [Cytophagales bacterium]|nr:MAG: acyl-CoA thioesterase [Cytophagales bacterium]TAF61626.1 MAG: acyl-CoA thioesterase [Cytophagales bacterium]